METALRGRGISSQAMLGLSTAAAADEPVSGLTHGFYLYPARFSPRFVEAAIRAFTMPGDLVLDPFVGGGTTLIQAAVQGRPSVGCDINELAVFVSRVKTEMYSERDLGAVLRWAESLRLSTNLRARLGASEDRVREEHFRNASTKHTWHVRKFLEMAVSSADSLRSRRRVNLARCILLRLGRWALDCRVRIPKAQELRSKVEELAAEMAQGGREFSSFVRSAAETSNQDTGAIAPICLHTSVIGLDRSRHVVQSGAPKLVVCSPPYPGMHVLYHRWQVNGRRETPAPYWIAGCTDGQESSYYTMGGRSQIGLQQYFTKIGLAFSSLAELVARDTAIVQLVSFSNPPVQLPRYLESMEQAGFTEHFLPRKNAPSADGRLWRAVPNRRWYNHGPRTDEARREVVLFHYLT